MKFILVALVWCMSLCCVAQQGMEEMWDQSSSAKQHSNIRWFREAKFGLFIHWGLYSRLAGTWDGKNYYGSGEWIMNQAKIPVSRYRKVAESFNPVNFNADEWAQLAKDAGIKYMVITAKHHEGFSMFDSKVTDFDIVDATPYKKDPMKALAAATRKRGIQFGFYYSQFQDWYEPNGGRNTWDFDESKKDYQQYYRQKAIPQLKELLTNYGPLGIVWFDTPGGMTREQTQAFIDELRVLQPQSLFSSRVGQGLGDYKDFGDSEVPPVPIEGAWESIYTHNDSWGYIAHDMNFKSSHEIIRLLSNVASKGGNLMLNVGPDGKGNIPYYSIKYLKETGAWLQKNGESIYASTAGWIPAQPWGVTTAKPGRLFLHIWEQPGNGQLLVPGFANRVTRVYALTDKKVLSYNQNGSDLVVNTTALRSEHTPDKVVVVEYSGTTPAYNATAPVTVSAQYAVNPVNAVFAAVKGQARVESLTYSHYFGDWKHTTCITGMRAPEDAVSFTVRVTEPGDYKLVLEYACPQESAKQEGRLEVDGKTYMFRTLRTSEFDKSAPLLFIKHPVTIFTVQKAGVYTITISPCRQGKELFKLKGIIAEPLK
ncbi:alpha-L-fucosidase [Niabella drilacis]|uniref:alpha-L-fucosidase n=1 Tax=Niabella drilacis (strain DSM 25811 / CCM 8410 / CCUG 62505 / LMG 26954 / E90) TaxID=1285928 RepID=A0A1G6I9Y3_NIADE|nr:alpha-L-fucosidase [Niabella drilacis]SDC03248.1 alpha-L-fucosidase [Niabella drilacis]